MDFIQAPWPWYVSGPLIAVVMGLLMWLGATFGVSSNLRTMCAIAGGHRVAKFFDFDWKGQIWNLVFVVGAMFGGYLAYTYLLDAHPLLIASSTKESLASLGFSFDGGWLPANWFGAGKWSSGAVLMVLVVGGFLVGFGARYAGGCTSGHAISGLSNFQLPSLIAVIGFFIGGLMMTHVVFPLIF